MSLMNWEGKVRTKSEIVKNLGAAGLQLDNVFLSHQPPWGILEASLKAVAPCADAPRTQKARYATLDDVCHGLKLPSFCIITRHPTKQAVGMARVMRKE
jgi:hypothetical protein